MILDLVSGIEDGQHLAIGGVTPGQKSLQSQNRERALVLSAKQTQLQVMQPPHLKHHTLCSLAAACGW